jgi:uncharacterized protein involved in exopolysaccharide biosynthesis
MQMKNEPSAWQSVTDSVPLWDGLSVVWRHRWKMAFCFTGVMSLVVLATVLKSKQYVSEGKLLVRLGRENVGLDPTATLGDSQNINITQTRQSEINSVAALLSNYNLSEKTVDRVGFERILKGDTKQGEAESPNALSAMMTGLTDNRLVSPLLGELVPSRKLTPRENAIRRLRKKLKIEAIADSNLVSVKYESRDPELSREVVESLIDLYLDEHVQLHRNPGTHEFLSEQTAEVGNQLRSNEERLRALKNETGLISPAEQLSALVGQVAKLHEQHVDVQAQSAELSGQVVSLREKLANLSKTLVLEETEGVANHASDGMRGQLYALQMEEKGLLASHTSDHFRVRKIRQQIEEAKKILEAEDDSRTEMTTGPNRVYEEAELELILKEPVLAALTEKEKALSRLLAEAKSELQSLNDNQIKVAQLTREIEIQETNYRKYAIDTEQARIDHSLETARISNIAVAQPATLEPYPASPKVALNLLLGFIAAVCASCGLAFASESLERWKQAKAGENDQDWEQRGSTREGSRSPRKSVATTPVRERELETVHALQPEPTRSRESTPTTAADSADAPDEYPLPAALVTRPR